MVKDIAPLAKIKALVLYFSSHTSTRNLGKVKLMKLFYFADFTHIRRYGLPITGDLYRNLEHGPIPSTIKLLVDSVEDEPSSAILGDIIKVDVKEGQRIHRIVSKREYTAEDEKLFSASELEVLKEISTKFKDTSTSAIEEMSHEEAPWKLTSELQYIPYELALKNADSNISAEELRLLSIL